MAAHARQIIESLREEIERIERRPIARGGFVASGRPEVDALLPGGGFARGRLTELAGGPASGKTGLALSALASAMGERGLGAFIDARGELYPPAASALGVDLERLLVVRPFGPPGTQQRMSTALWAAEAILGSGAFEALVLDVPASLPPERAGLEAMVRRVRAAAERGGALAIWLGEGTVHVPAAVRLEVAQGSGGVVVRPARERQAPGGRVVRPAEERQAPGGVIRPARERLRNARMPETGELFALPRREGAHHAA